MAKINNQEVLQKLIDELKLYPGNEPVPTELAEKILPVFQINTEEITIIQTPANIVRTNATIANGNTQTIYTVPSTGKFYLTNASITTANEATAANDITVRAELKCTPDGDSEQVLLQGVHSHANGAYGETPAQQTLNLQNPILLEAGSTITVTADNTALAYGTIVGYTQAD